MRDLSGGEKGRLALAKLIYSRVNVLVLDEPTNHLDIPSREALEEALSAYEGTIVTISHDRYFLDRVATQILALDGVGGAEHYDGDYTEYHDWKLGFRGSAPPPMISSSDNLVSVALNLLFTKNRRLRLRSFSRCEETWRQSNQEEESRRAHTGGCRDRHRSR